MINSNISNQSFGSVIINNNQQKMIRKALKTESPKFKETYQKLLKYCKKSTAHTIEVTEAGNVYLNCTPVKGFSTTLHNLLNALKTFKMLNNIRGIV